MSIDVLIGVMNGFSGPVMNMPMDVSLADVTMMQEKSLRIPISKGASSFVYMLEGVLSIGKEHSREVSEGMTAVLGDGEEVLLVSAPSGARFLLANGSPLKEPVAWGGPVVMNTREEVQTALREIGEDTYIKEAPKI